MRMKTRNPIGPLVPWCFYFLAATALARAAFAENAITLRTPQEPVPVGGIVEIELAMDFDDPTIGGGFQVEFDPEALELVDFRFDRALGDDPRYRCTEATPRCAARHGAHRAPIGFGRFDGLSGARPIGRLRLRGRAPGTSPVALVPLPTTGGFVDLAGEGLAVDADADGIVVVPEPGMTALLAAGGAGLAWRSRRARGVAA